MNEDIVLINSGATLNCVGDAGSAFAIQAACTAWRKHMAHNAARKNITWTAGLNRECRDVDVAIGYVQCIVFVYRKMVGFDNNDVGYAVPKHIGHFTVWPIEIGREYNIEAGHSTSILWPLDPHAVAWLHAPHRFYHCLFVTHAMGDILWSYFFRRRPSPRQGGRIISLGPPWVASRRHNVDDYPCSWS